MVDVAVVRGGLQAVDQAGGGDGRQDLPDMFPLYAGFPEMRLVSISDAQRKPSSGISTKAKAEVDYLLARIAVSDRRARI